MMKPDAQTVSAALARLARNIDEAERAMTPPSPLPASLPLDIPDDAFLPFIRDAIDGENPSVQQDSLEKGKEDGRQVQFLGASDVLFPDTEARDYSSCSLKELSTLVSSCKNCRLCETRTYTVFGEGQEEHPVVMVIGEGPGRDEDLSGRPFVGKGGQYMDRWFAPIGVSRQTNAYIANIVKCRPPGNRDPLPDEVQACIPYLRRQIALVQPRVILLAGAVAAHAILETKEGVGALRGRTFSYMNIPVIVTYHPAGVLRNLDRLRAPVWEDMKRLASMVGLPVHAGKKQT
ncbi:uracil-DNA glycosylase [Parasphaerochaeta coccoides]|uniref:Type-4 uracil-DNA glycosylase n=1 Tax=Parasphaerochaeta coccoides (strain ATCC BAA-1237 / DSM 17374 / SPN1) TaxID=760011 RepID=F4GI57_PARC1|nr:uracil-DNA glycosylase [Parasphaerochaeta coccoides]AEC02655.1 phage SPO1 DNA polymerase-related protein [Parasphaerochaeta coccoides DSM 17374]